MPSQSREVLKTYFNHNDTPDEPEFIDLIDSMVNLADPGTQIIQGTLSASALLSETYNFDAFSFSETNSVNLTGSNQFGTSSAHTQSFSGSFHQSGGCDSYFLNNLNIGTTTSPQSCEGGLTIFKTLTIGNSDNPLSQSINSSLLISSSTSQLNFDANEIHQYGSSLIITSQGDSTTSGNIIFKTGDTNTPATSSSTLYLSASGYVGVGLNSDKYASNFETTGSVAFTGQNVYFTLDDYDNGEATANFSTTGSRLISRQNNLMIWNGGLTVGQYDEDESGTLYQIDNGTLTVKNSALFNSNITASINISASGHLFVSMSDSDGTVDHHVAMYNTSSGQLFYTASYGGGGGGTTVAANPGSSAGGALSTITIGGTNYSVGGGAFWQNHANGVELTTSADKVGIGTSPSSVHRLLVNGNGVFTGDVIAYYTSDKRLKDNIKPIEDPIGKLKKIGGYSFDWNDKQNTYEGTDFGVIAQEIEEVLPSLVQTREDGYKGVKYDKIVSLLIEAVKDQQKQIDELKKLI
tara:strand:+ start:1728 stop:3293 length:1566 start_codon:yes stop_codon:yes gene_type:complete